MPRVSFTPNLRRHLDCPDLVVDGTTLRQVLNSVFAANSAVRGYILDDQDCLRKHVTVFINGQPVKDRQNLSDTVAADGEVFVMQALSGG